VLLYLGGSLALLFNGPGRFSFDAGMVPELFAGVEAADVAEPGSAAGLTPATVAVPVLTRAD